MHKRPWRGGPRGRGHAPIAPAHNEDNQPNEGIDKRQGPPVIRPAAPPPRPYRGRGRGQNSPQRRGHPSPSRGHPDARPRGGSRGYHTPPSLRGGWHGPGPERAHDGPYTAWGRGSRGARGAYRGETRGGRGASMSSRPSAPQPPEPTSSADHLDDAHFPIWKTPEAGAPRSQRPLAKHLQETSGKGAGPSRPSTSRAHAVPSTPPKRVAPPPPPVLGSPLNMKSPQQRDRHSSAAGSAHSDDRPRPAWGAQRASALSEFLSLKAEYGEVVSLPQPHNTPPTQDVPLASDSEPEPESPADAIPPSPKRRKLSHPSSPTPAALLLLDISPADPVRVKRERSPSPDLALLARRTITAGVKRYAVPPECTRSDPAYVVNRKRWLRRETATLKALGMHVERFLVRADGMLIDWTSSEPVWADTLLPVEMPEEIPPPPAHDQSPSMPKKPRMSTPLKQHVTEVIDVDDLEEHGTPPRPLSPFPPQRREPRHVTSRPLLPFSELDDIISSPLNDLRTSSPPPVLRSSPEPPPHHPHEDPDEHPSTPDAFPTSVQGQSPRRSASISSNGRSHSLPPFATLDNPSSPPAERAPEDDTWSDDDAVDELASDDILSVLQPTLADLGCDTGYSDELGLAPRELAQWIEGADASPRECALHFVDALTGARCVEVFQAMIREVAVLVERDGKSVLVVKEAWRSGEDAGMEVKTKALEKQALEWSRRYVATFQADRGDLASAYAQEATFSWRQVQTARASSGDSDRPPLPKSGRLEVVRALLALDILELATPGADGQCNLAFDVVCHSSPRCVLLSVGSAGRYRHGGPAHIQQAFVLRRKEWIEEDRHTEGAWPLVAVCHQMMVINMADI